MVKETSNSSHEWILEPYIKGPEYSVETVSSRGTHFILGITENKQLANLTLSRLGILFRRDWNNRRSDKSSKWR